MFKLLRVFGELFLAILTVSLAIMIFRDMKECRELIDYKPECKE